MTEYTITINDQDIGVIAAGIKKLPWDMAQPLFEKLHAQMQSQLVPAETQKPELKLRKRKMNGHAPSLATKNDAA